MFVTIFSTDTEALRKHSQSGLVYPGSKDYPYYFVQCSIKDKSELSDCFTHESESMCINMCLDMDGTLWANVGGKP